MLLYILACSDPAQDSKAAADTTETSRDSVETAVDSADTTDTGTDSDTEPDSDSTQVETDSPPPWETGSWGPMELDIETSYDAKLLGEEAGDAGPDPEIGLAGPGDVDGDGLDDIVVGLRYVEEGGTYCSGAAYVVSGGVRGLVDLADATAILYGSGEDGAGYAVAGGDFDGDGFSDVLVGAPWDVGQDMVYVVDGPVSGVVDLAAEADAFLVGGADGTGYELVNVGDMDGDGRDDVAIPGYSNDEAYVLSGPFSGTMPLGEHASMTVSLLALDHVGRAGDTDGDGFDDLVIGGTDAIPVYALLFEGPARGDLTGADADATFTGPEDPPTYEISPAGAGDVDGDGYADLLFREPLLHGEQETNYAGRVHLVLGPFGSGTDFTTGVAVFEGAEEYGRLGIAMTSPGDMDGDGRDDVFVAAPYTVYSVGDDAGQAYLCVAPFAGSISVADCPVTLRGSDDDRAGSIVASAGDVDGDGWPDLLIGGPGDDEGGGDNAGAAWLFTAWTLHGL